MNNALQKKEIDTSHFSAEEMKRITDYIILLQTIKQKINTSNSKKEERL